ncbi:uncharacterized protein B0P05DRAFT_527262 [Gilbertella persicaria]|uniref:uncharacterized protein n=1 Tax=Gilbertella persicaria TaxID=101096 RepID=UPI00221F5D8C|nr:uncharacterized protein B0P05DRAFT_527262 [Gilbertella persicaria]KAI8091383.1 hypothetical protein B0P05DRAFT_527262 [Gilbertella persicaria]
MSIQPEPNTHTVNEKDVSILVRQKKKERSDIRKSLCLETMMVEEEIQPVESPKLTTEEDLFPILEPSTALSPIASTLTINPSIKTSETQSTFDYHDSDSIFPYTNKIHDTRQRTIAEESKQWESFFDPQYILGSFQQGIGYPIKHYFYQGKWPLDQQDIVGMTPTLRKKKFNHMMNGTPVLSSRSPSMNSTTFPDLLFPAVPSPTLPNKEELEFHIHLPQQDQSLSTSQQQIEILPCPSLSLFPKHKNVENEALWKERLELLREIQAEGFSMEMNGTQSDPYKASGKAVRLQKQLKRTATKIKQETMVELCSNDDDEKQVHQDQFAVAMHPDTLCLPEQNEFNHEKEQEILCSARSSIDQEVFETKRKNRPSFLLFACGFLFPPLWIMGALYTPSTSIPRTAASKLIDEKWKKYSRNALFILLLLMVGVFILVATLKPHILGFRNSNENGYQADRVVFDSDDK